MSIKVFSPQVSNLGDFFNGMPVLSGISKSIGESIDLVVNDKLMMFNGLREFMEFQPCINTLRFRKEVLNMDEKSYLIATYSQEEFRNLTERPNRPIETMRWEKFVRDNYPTLSFKVDDDFVFETEPVIERSETRYIIGDRWLNNGTDTRRASNIFKDSGLFANDWRFRFIDYKDSLMDNAVIMKSSSKPFLGTFTGSGMLADLLNIPNYCVWEDSMVNWNNSPVIDYSYHKHYYKNRPNTLVHITDIKDLLDDYTC